MLGAIYCWPSYFVFHKNLNHYPMFIMGGNPSIQIGSNTLTNKKFLNIFFHYSWEFSIILGFHIVVIKGGTSFANKTGKLRAPLSHWPKTYNLIFFHEYTCYWKPESTSSPLSQALGENWRKCLLEDAKEAETHLWIPSGQTHGTTNFLNFAFLWSPLWSPFYFSFWIFMAQALGLFSWGKKHSFGHCPREQKG